MGYYGSFGQTTTGTLPSGSGTATTSVTGGAGPSPGTLQSWSYAPIIIAAMQQNMALFTNPRNDRPGWHAFAVQLLVAMGYMDPGRESDAQGAVYALAQAFGYYWQPGTERFQKIVQADQQERMLDLLNYDVSAITTYKTVHPPVQPGVLVSKSFLQRMWTERGILPSGPAAPVPPPAAPAASSPWLLLGGVAVVGAAAYFLI